MPQKQVMTSLDLLWSDKDELADAINQISIYPVVIDKYPDHFKQILTMIIQYIHMHPNTDPFCFRFFRFSFCNTVAKCTLTYSRPILKNNDLNILPADYNKKSSHLFFLTIRELSEQICCEKKVWIWFWQHLFNPSMTIILKFWTKTAALGQCYGEALFVASEQSQFMISRGRRRSEVVCSWLRHRRRLAWPFRAVAPG